MLFSINNEKKGQTLLQGLQSILLSGTLIATYR